MSSVESIIDTEKFSEWIELKTNAAKKCFNKQVGEWSSDAATIANIHDVWQDERPVKQQKIDNDQK